VREKKINVKILIRERGERKDGGKRKYVKNFFLYILTDILKKQRVRKNEY